MKFSQQANHVREHISLVDEINKHTALTKKDNGMLYGECPFCKPRQGVSLLFVLNPDKNIFYCQACHKNGDIVSFVAQIEEISPLEALKKISDMHDKCIDCISMESIQSELQITSPHPTLSEHVQETSCDKKGK